LYLESDISQRRSTIDTIFQLKEGNQMSLLDNYSLWDDMVHYLNTHDGYWAENNLGTLTKSFPYSLVQVYNTKHKLVYNRTADSFPGLEGFVIEAEVLDSLATKKRLFYNTRYSNTIAAIAVASIHTTSDTTRSSTPAGYLLIAQAWDYHYLNELAKSLNYDVRISLTEPVAEEADYSQYNTKIQRPINNWYDKTIAWLVFYSSNPFLNELRALGNLIIFGTMGFILIFLVIQFVLIQQWITTPLKLISQSLKENNPELIRPIDHRNNEFADIAALIERFFIQKQELVLEIEERIHTEALLKEIEEQTRKILLTSPESIIVTDLDGVILTANDETLRLVAVDYESDLTGRAASILELAPPENSASLRNLINDLRKGSYIKNLEITLVDAQGQHFPALISASVIADNNQKASKLVFITRNLSDLKSLEMKLRQAQKMESIGTLAGGIAHDFNNIITIIAGYIALSAGKIDNHPDAEEDLDEALKACLRAKSLIGKILTFSRQSEVKVKPIVLADIIEDSVPMIRASIPSKINIVTDISSFSYTVADPNEIQQVLMNLSSNSYHAMRSDTGTLTISLKEIHGFELIGLDPEVKLSSDYLHLSFSDTGIGITSDIITRIFDPYFSTKGLGEGTGLGLSIVHGIITGYRGFVDVASTVGEGCTVHIYLPVSDHVDTELPAIETHAYPFLPANLMMVDDEPSLAELFATALRDVGYHVQSFCDSAEALMAFSDNPDAFDLIIADITMPVLDGIQLASKMRSIKEVPIILYTGFCDKHIQTRAHDIQVNKLLNKPILPEELVREVKEVIYLNNSSIS
ncbi:MAG: response regulator, partial [Candidatus Cloacimonetes bacterium]|nr:response regulator [Candidatus Cloacimonadota bacterium]